MSVSLVDASVSDVSAEAVMSKGGAVGGAYQKKTGYPTQTSSGDVNAPKPWLDVQEIRQQQDYASSGASDYQDIVNATNKCVACIKSWLDAWDRRYGPSAVDAFGLEWRYFRTCVSLQVRLLIEQVLYERGGGWRRFVSGFKPIG